MDRNQTNKVLLKDEQVLYTYKPYFKKELFSIILGALAISAMFIITILAIFFDAEAPDFVTFVVLGVYIITIFLTILLQLLAYRNRFYTITNKRLIIQKGLLGIDFSSIPIEGIQYISVNVTVIDKILNKGTGSIAFGTVSTPVTAGQVPKFIFSNINDVYENYKVLKEVIDEKSENKIKE